MADFKFEPMRSFMFINCAKEDYRPLIHRWLYKTHVQDSIAQFDPYVTKYGYHPSYPTPPKADRFGYNCMQLVEHYWLVNDCDPRLQIKAIAETFPPDVLVWMGLMPENAGGMESFEREGDIGNNVRQVNNAEANPMIFCFLPMWWEDDIKGKGRTLEDGANYRWIVALGYPDNVSKEEGDQWLFEEVLPVFENADECTRILHSKVKKEINGCPMDHVFQFWFDNQTGWYRTAVEKTKDLKRPVWATQDVFPFLKPYHQINSICVADFTMSDNLKNYHGYLTMR